MLRDDAIREGKILPTKEDVKRMNISDEEHAEIKSKHAELNPAPAAEAPKAPEAPAADGKGKGAGK